MTASVYRVRAADGSLLYVGCSADPTRRMAQHASDKTWWADAVVVDLRAFPSRVEALAAEKVAIQTEKPLYNRQWSWRPSQPQQKLTGAPVAPLLKASQVAEKLRTSTASVHKWAKDGTIPAVRIGGVVRFRRDDVEALLESKKAS